MAQMMAVFSLSTIATGLCEQAVNRCSPKKHCTRFGRIVVCAFMFTVAAAYMRRQVIVVIILIPNKSFMRALRAGKFFTAFIKVKFVGW